MEGEWVNAGSSVENKKEIAQLVVFVMVGCARALRGKKIPKLEITGFLEQFANGDKTEPKRAVLSLVGRFKQEEGGVLSVVSLTGSKLRIREWARRLLEMKVRSGQTKCFLSQGKNGSSAQMGDFGEPLIERLVWIQKNAQG
jgi:hypothetical protein